MPIRNALVQVIVSISWLHMTVSSNRPNIIIIIADDLGWNDVSFHGSNQILTPNIDALAYNGIILNSHYVPALCTPSRASLLTGKYPTSIGMQHLVILAAEPWGLPLQETLMPEYFKRHGYSTHAIGKWHLGFYQKEYTPTYRGFDTHFGYWNGYQDYYDHTMQEGTESGYDMRRGMAIDYESQGKYSTDVFTEEAVSVIKNHNSTKGPLFLYLAHLAVHAGNDDKPFQAPDDEVAKHSYIKDPERRVYAAMVSRMDESVGRVISALRDNDMIDNSIILFISDNGAVSFGVHSNHGSNYPLRGLKESPWEGGVRGVAALWSPLLNQTQRVSNQLMHVSDWLPTLYTAAGLDTSELGHIDGKNMWNSLSHDLESPRTEVFNNYDEIEGYSSLRVGPWKYISGTAQAGEVDDWYGESGEDAKELGYDISKIMESKTNIAINGYITDKQLEYYRKFDKKPPELMTTETIQKLRKSAIVTCDHVTMSSFLKNNETDRSTATKNHAKTSNGFPNLSDLKREIFQKLEEINDRLSTNSSKKSQSNNQQQTVTSNRELADIFNCDPLKQVCLFNLENDPCEKFNLAQVFPDVVQILEIRLKDLKKSVVKPLNTLEDPFASPSLYNNTWTNWHDRKKEHQSITFNFIKIVLDPITFVSNSEILDFQLLLMDNIMIKIILSPILLIFREALHLTIQLAISLLSIVVVAVVVALFVFVWSVVKKSKVFNESDDMTCKYRIQLGSIKDNFSSRLMNYSSDEN